jgi:anti-sigma factor ChrR (cupin superfamily)
MKDMGWTSVRGVSIREPFKGIHVYELWTGENGAKAQFVEIEPGAVFEGLEVHERGPEEIFVVSGTFNDGVRDYEAGTFIHNPAGSSHVPQSKTGCTFFVFLPES